MSFGATYKKHTLNFKFEAGTSRGILTNKETFFVKVFNQKYPQIFGLGECSPLKGLSIDDIPDFEVQLNEICESIPLLSKHPYPLPLKEVLEDFIGPQFPSIQFGFETAFLDLQNGGNRIIFQNDFVTGKKGIPINGLIWMGEEAFMLSQIEKKLEQGYKCIKIKIGAIDFDRECVLLGYIRQRYSADQISIRVDANGAFTSEEALEKLKILSTFNLHSIEQPIGQGQIEEIASLCAQTPLPIALDEELIGIMQLENKKELLKIIKPHYIILKPSLLGGFLHCQEWIELAEQLQVGWWITSALESNVGLNAISQFTYSLGNTLPQGLGTGQLFTNNIDSPLEISADHLFYNPSKEWHIDRLI